MIRRLSLAQWTRECHNVAFRLGRAAGHSSLDLVGQLAVTAALRQRLGHPARTDPDRAYAAPTVVPSAKPRVRQPDWQRLGLGGLEDAEGRN